VEGRQHGRPPLRMPSGAESLLTHFAVPRLRSPFVRPAKDKAIVELPLDRDAEECLPNSEYSLPPRPTLVFGSAAGYRRPPVLPKTRQAIRGV
jgi:hypothetical protein